MPLYQPQKTHGSVWPPLQTPVHKSDEGKERRLLQVQVCPAQLERSPLKPINLQTTDRANYLPNQPNQSSDQSSILPEIKQSSLRLLARLQHQMGSLLSPSTDIVESQEPSEVYGYDQDSEVEIEQIESKARNQKADDDNEDNFLYVDDFFEPPFWKKGTKLTGFVPTKRFESWFLNQILVIWQVRHALPWSRIKDAELRAAFLYANKDARLYLQRWSADEAKQLYAGLRKKVFEELDNLDTTFTLIHDVWTTKGNRFAFIGAAVTYINSNWQFVVRHLALKMIPWKHKGELLARPIVNLLKKPQTTDSGSNNNTMASTMYELFDLYSDGQSTWDPTSMHIRCACHKFALIVNGGLQALTLKILPPAKIKQLVLGFFPVLGKLPEEVNQLADIPEENEGEEAYESDYGNADDKDHTPNRNRKSIPTTRKRPNHHRLSRARHIKSAKLRALTDQLDVVIKQITRSVAQRSLFEQTAKSMGIQSRAQRQTATLRSKIAGWPLCPGAQKRKRSARIALSLPESASGSGAAHHTTLVALLKSLPRFLCAAAPRIGSAHAALLALSAAAVLHIPLLRQLAFPSALPSNHLQTIIPPCPYPMASEKLPDDVPSTPPNTSEDPSVPQSTRRESSRIHTPISRPGFIRTASDSRRALIGIPNEQHRRPSITADSHPVTEDPRGGTKSDDEEVEPQATSQRRVTKKVASKVHQVSKRTGKGIETREGDGPKLPMVLYEYARLLASLEKKKIAADSTALERMFYPMITITKKYLDLAAVHCDAVIMATFLHPAWRMMLFTDRYPVHLQRINKLILDVFTDREALLKTQQPDPSPPKCTQSEANASGIDSDSDGDAFNYYPTTGDTLDINTELDQYNSGEFPLDKKGCVLGWWKAHSKDFPVLSSLARDYLACAASSASVERTFPAAARVCATGRSSLAIRTIKRCISSHMWLRDSVRVGGLFADCQALIDDGLKNPKFARYTVKPVKKSRDIRR
ncbi:hypothetical protein PSHT_05558 [Puccinia striiformis]|uniref:HAT C-terminal dimerisation domain-containing protein n=1 Tax=Puccinia striiformis TaxID=27350 RepID=A0A2S4WAK0_9BASI|nr:hypothetical protein PSHT_05558 [Puccinia striiformis]